MKTKTFNSQIYLICCLKTVSFSDVNFFTANCMCCWWRQQKQDSFWKFNHLEKISIGRWSNIKLHKKSANSFIIHLKHAANSVIIHLSIKIICFYVTTITTVNMNHVIISESASNKVI
jgi:hypothetical protein